MTTNDVTFILRVLADSTEALNQAADLRDSLLRRRRHWISKAAKRGATTAEIADATGLTRQRIGQILKRREQT